MTFKEYLDQSWSAHQTAAKKIAEEFKDNFKLMDSEEDVMSMAALIVHICGEHLGQWEQGIELLKKLKNNAPIKDKEQMKRYVGILTLGNNPNISIEDFSTSDKVRICAGTASALANLGGLKNAEKLFDKATDYAVDLLPEDAGNKALAIAANNIASAFEEKNLKSASEATLMMKTGLAARKYWELAGTWKEVERAEYLLARIFIKTLAWDKSLLHAEKCLAIVTENGSEPYELFFAYEVLVKANRVLKNQLGVDGAVIGMEMAFDKLSAEEKSNCKTILEKTIEA